MCDVLLDDKQSERENPWDTKVANLNSNVLPTTTHGKLLNIDERALLRYCDPVLSDEEVVYYHGTSSLSSNGSYIYTHGKHHDIINQTGNLEQSLSGDEWQDVQTQSAYLTPALSDDDDQESQYVHSNALSPTNVIVFGESGVGKSSIINMLVGEPVATVSNQAAGCTFASTKFRATINGREVILYDTAGLDESETGTVSPRQAIQNLRSLVTELTTVNLLVYVIRGTRLRKIVSDNYHMFRAMIHGGDCDVPVVLVITGLENEENMDDWWEDNEAYLAQYKLMFCGHACITATKGRAFRNGSGHIFEDLYDASRKKVVDLLAEHAFNSSITIAPVPKDTIVRKLWNLLGVVVSELYEVASDMKDVIF